MNILNIDKNDKVLSIAIDKSKYNLNEQFKLSPFTIEEKIGDSIILYNTINTCLVELSTAEYKYVFSVTGKELLQTSYAVLIDNYFLTPKNIDNSIIRNYFDTNVWSQIHPDEFFKEITNYVIFTTTDCNARCFYCYEKGSSKIKMTPKTAKDVANFIVNEFNNLKEHNNHKVNLQWFGGEPMYNTEVIDIIIDTLNENNIPYRSSMISNGLLFTPELCSIAKTKWKLQGIQITLDGTEKIYNKTKNYINISKSDNPFNTVIDNIKLLLSQGIKVTVRLNTDLHNGDDLKLLIKYLDREIGHPEGFTVYPALLFENINGFVHTEEERKNLYLKLEELIMFTEYYKYSNVESLLKRSSETTKTNHCMIDSGCAVTILPNGNVGTCEHFIDKHIIGSIYTPKEEWNYEIAKDLATSLKPEGEYCKTCPYYGTCRPLTYCDGERICTAEQYNLLLLANKLHIRDIYYNIKNKLSMNNCNSNCNNNNQSYHLDRIANELELLNDYKSLTLWERIKILLGLNVYRDPHKHQQTDYNNKTKES